MTLHVSISDFRDNIADYLDRITQGVTVVIKDEKRNRELAQVVGRKKFDPLSYKAMLKRVAGSITKEKHPEWTSTATLETWLRKSRISEERF